MRWQLFVTAKKLRQQRRRWGRRWQQRPRTIVESNFLSSFVLTSAMSSHLPFFPWWIVRKFNVWTNEMRTIESICEMIWKISPVWVSVVDIHSPRTYTFKPICFKNQSQSEIDELHETIIPLSLDFVYIIESTAIKIILLFASFFFISFVPLGWSAKLAHTHTSESFGSVFAGVLEK